MMKSRDEIIDNVERFFKIEGSVSIQNGKIDVAGSVRPTNHLNSQIPIEFGTVSGRFSCRDRGLISLKNCPSYVGGNFDCRGNLLESLEFGPATVQRDYFCDGNKLKTLQGAPSRIPGGMLDCSMNQLKNLIGCSTPLYDLDCSTNPLESLEGLPKDLNSVVLDWSPNLPLLRLVESNNNLGLLRNTKVERIISKYMMGSEGARRRILACQKELIDAGYEGNASW